MCLSECVFSPRVLSVYVCLDNTAIYIRVVLGRIREVTVMMTLRVEGH